MCNLTDVAATGQSFWLNYLRRFFISSGELRRLVDEGVGGIVYNIPLCERTVRCSADYDQALQQLIWEGRPVKKIHQALIIDDVQCAADALYAVYEASRGRDGYVSVELDPAVVDDPTEIYAETRHMLALFNRPNVMFQVPATPAGISAVQHLIADGINLHVSHIYSLEKYEQVARAYLAGLEAYLAGHSVWRSTPASVAGLAVGPLARAIDAAVLNLSDGRSLAAGSLEGSGGVALAKVIYGRFRQLFQGPRWQKLARSGAQPQRLLWSDTDVTGFTLPATDYVEALMGPDTVSVLSPATLNAFRRQGSVTNFLREGLPGAEAELTALAELGVDLSSIGHKLQEDALAAAQRVHQNLIHSVIQKRNQMEDEWRRMSVHLHDYQAAVDEAAGAMCEQRLLHQIWDHDPALWQEPSFHFRGGSSWLHLPALMPENSGRIHRLLETARETGYTDAVLFGTGESRLAGELFSRRSSLLARSGFAGPPFLNLWLLDPVIPAAAFARSMQLNPHKTLYVVASKSGEEMEMLYALDLFYNRASTVLGEGEAKNHFVAVTDPGSRLVEIAQRYGFRDVFVNDPAVSGRYATLSYFGLLPAALAGVDVDLLLEGALMAACNAECCNCAVKEDNVAALLGTILGVLARNGRDKLLLVTSPALATFGEWVGRLMADNLRQAPASPIPWSGMRRPSDARPPRPPATIQPIAAAAVPEPAWFGSDHLTVYLRLEGDGSHDQSVSALQEAGQPVVTLRWQDVCELGGQIFTWQMATAVAGYHLGATVLEL